MRVLFVNDDYALVPFLHQGRGMEGCDAECLSAGEAALVALAACPFDLIHSATKRNVAEVVPDAGYRLRGAVADIFRTAREDLLRRGFLPLLAEVWAAS
jgi:hypothetical protein